MSKEKQIEEIFNIIINRMLRVKRGGYIPMRVFVEITQDILGAGYRKQSGWISVEERLPEESGEYLVFGRTFGNKKPQIWICECISIGSVMGWCNSAKNPIVEAWMPLPEAPKGGAG